MAHAGCWLLYSGIQEATGGVARYYRCDAAANAGVSAEITGYAVSALVYLYELSGDATYLDAALRSSRYLTRVAWDGSGCTFPFEPASKLAYFFDTGIMVRGLMAAWRATGEEEFRDRACEASLSLAFDFIGEGVFHPVISLPEKQPLAYEPRWSRSPGCYQLKSALAWRDTGDENAIKLYDALLAYALATHESFLKRENDRARQMDRLHAYCYFLEGVLPVIDRPEVREALGFGLCNTARIFREIAPDFERSDVAAQLLRIRLIAHHGGVLPLDETAAREEAVCASSFQDLTAADRRLRGGFYFGRKQSALLPYSNPVSTAFCLQALALWEQHQSGRWGFQLSQLI